MARLVGVAQQPGLRVPVAYYPPYHRQYNPIERCWGFLEIHWNGALLDSVEAIIKFAETMTWTGRPPVVNVVTTTYQKGITLTKAVMEAVEAQFTRLPGVEKWFIDIAPVPCGSRDS